MTLLAARIPRPSVTSPSPLLYVACYALLFSYTVLLTCFTALSLLGLYAVPTVEVSHVATWTTCRDTSLSAIYRQIFHTPWFFCHVLGWCFKMLVFRSWPVCLLAALAFELAEVTLVRAVPQFEECWWDSLLLDYAAANLLGMGAGAWILRRLGPRDGWGPEAYDWPGGDAPADVPSASRTLALLAPFPRPFRQQSRPERYCDALARPRHGAALAVAIAFATTTEVGVFLLRNTFPPLKHASYAAFRTVAAAVLAIVSGREWYARVERGGPALGQPYTNLLLGTTAVEYLAAGLFLPPAVRSQIFQEGNLA